MSVTRGEFLRSLGKSLPGLVLGSGAVVAQKLFSKMAAVSGEPPALAPRSPLPEAQPSRATATVETISSGPAAGNRVALTFDDGPTPGVTDRILDEFRQRGLHATFFMIGQRIAAEPDLARRVLAEGHEIGNHTYTHPKLTDLPPAKVEEEVQKTQDIAADLLGLTPRWFRPPYFAFRGNLAPIVQSRGLRIVHGSVDPADWSQPGEEHILNVVTRECKAGSIVICHDLNAQTANAIGRILDALMQAGLTPVTLSNLMVS